MFEADPLILQILVYISCVIHLCSLVTSTFVVLCMVTMTVLTIKCFVEAKFDSIIV